ncbi:MAG: IclR family transcriptional regulator [Lentisphaerae bacterium]|jgi:DNA-binding IclR family transcriptional regulator|nr:IclR family transcriptional regulator [Lentisphaerota bacterium]MBT5607311.1 IclR family transcriptional regulator [Lentisphaerota bacterium]MBT7055371.1 IclR family transcriptional regulator [Lentisphaerota bacterium]MBT7840969.1 IclR family transcriptional regulator [Lentisphaerota bacterium]
MSAPRKSLNQSLENALDLLELLPQRGAMRSGEIAHELALKPNTANNMARTLLSRGYLTQDGLGRYHLGPQCFFLGQEQSVFREFRRVALPHMLQLSCDTGDNAFLGIECDGRLYMVAHTEGTNVIRVSEPQKWQKQFHCSAAGKVILAERGQAWLEETTGGESLAKLTGATRTSQSALSGDIARTRERGFAECIDEAAEGIHAVGVAVRRTNGELLAALSQSFPSFFVAEGRVDVSRRVALLRNCADELGRHLEIAFERGVDRPE